jgi:hypothetical protein
MRVDYTLQQAVAMVDMINDQFRLHRRTHECECWTLLDKEYDEYLCEEGQRLLKLFLKWNRRYVTAGKRELGKSLTPSRCR